MTTSNDFRSIALKIESRLPSLVTSERIGHIRRVTETMNELAERFYLDAAKGMLVGLAHDMDRDLPRDNSYALLTDWGISVSTFERKNPSLLHGPITAERLRREYGVTDHSILLAVRHHTLGSPHLDSLGLALYIADFCEPGREFPDAQTRTDILQLTTLEAMVKRIISISRKKYGPLEEPTRQLYARVGGE